MTDEKDEKTLKQTTKRGLKVMRKTRAYHPIRNEARIIKYGVKGFGRNIGLSMAAMIVMAVTLVITFATITLNIILTNLAENTRDNVSLTVYFRPGLDEEKLTELAEIIASDKNVKSTEYSTSENEFRLYYVDNEAHSQLIEVVNDDIQQRTIETFPTLVRFKVYDNDDISSIKTLVETDETIQEYKHPTIAPSYKTKKEQIAQIVGFANVVKWGGAALGAVFLVISMLIISSTIRMAIFSRREEIYMEKLVGADRRFIRGPFLVEAEISGLIAGTLACIMSVVTFRALVPWFNAQENIDVSQIEELMKFPWILLVIAAFLAAGFLIGRLAARLAVRKYLHKM